MKWTLFCSLLSLVTLAMAQTSAFRSPGNSSSSSQLPSKITGTLSLGLYDNFETGKSTKRFFIEQNGDYTEIIPEDGDLPLDSGARVSLEKIGGFNAQSTSVGSGVGSGKNDRVVQMGTSSNRYKVNSNSTQTPPPIPPIPLGKQNILIITTVRDATKARLSNSALNYWDFARQEGTMSDFYAQASFNQISIAGKVVGPYLGAPCIDTDTFAAASFAVDQVRNDPAAQVNIKNFQHILIVQDNSCIKSWSGSAYGLYSPLKEEPNFHTTLAFAFDDGTILEWQRVAFHEIGHNLGASHASELACDQFDYFSIGCQQNAYEDGYSIMSRGQLHRVYDFNGYHKEKMGWLSGHVVEAREGTFTLYPTEEAAADGQIQLLKIALNPAPEMAHAHVETFYFTLEYRRPFGYDITIPPSVHMHLGQAGDVGKVGLDSYLLRSGSTSSMFTRTGVAYEDKINGFRLKIQEIGGPTAQVVIERFAPTPNTVSSIVFTPADRTSPLEYCTKASIQVSGTPVAGQKLSATFQMGPTGAPCPDGNLDSGRYVCEENPLPNYTGGTVFVKYAGATYRKDIPGWSCLHEQTNIRITSLQPGLTCGSLRVVAEVSPASPGLRVTFQVHDYTIQTLPDLNCSGSVNLDGTVACDFSNLDSHHDYQVTATSTNLNVAYDFQRSWTCADRQDKLEIISKTLGSFLPPGVVPDSQRACQALAIQTRTSGDNPLKRVTVIAKTHDGKTIGNCSATPDSRGLAWCILESLNSYQEYILDVIYGDAHATANFAPWNCRRRAASH